MLTERMTDAEIYGEMRADFDGVKFFLGKAGHAAVRRCKKAWARGEDAVSVLETDVYTAPRSGNRYDIFVSIDMLRHDAGRFDFMKDTSLRSSSCCCTSLETRHGRVRYVCDPAEDKYASGCLIAFLPHFFSRLRERGSLPEGATTEQVFCRVFECIGGGVAMYRTTSRVNHRAKNYHDRDADITNYYHPMLGGAAFIERRGLTAPDGRPFTLLKFKTFIDNDTLRAQQRAAMDAARVASAPHIAREILGESPSHEDYDRLFEYMLSNQI